MRHAIDWFTCWHCTLLVAAVYAVGAVYYVWDRLAMVREMSRFRCPRCGTLLGAVAVRAGEDASPFEELWSDDEGTHHWHCHPTCRKITCAACSTQFVLRWNTQGDKCGPRLAVRSEEYEGALPVIDRDALMDALRHRLPGAVVTAEQISPDYRSWQIEVRDARHHVNIAWGPLSGFGATDLDNIRGDVSPFLSYDWPMESADAALAFVERVFSVEERGS